MMSRQTDESLKALLAPPAPPAGFDERILRAVRERRAAGAAIAFDVDASTEGVARVRPGRGRIQAAGARARKLAEHMQEELAEYFEGLRAFFTVPVDLAATAPFQRSVLEAARRIPFGEVRSYGWVAARIGSPRAVRAVGTALGGNPVPFVVPCHRVLRSDGSLGGYGLGLDMKNRLLALEHDTPAIVGNDTTRILCRRGCPHDRRSSERHQVVFSSVAEARAVGYRPCRHCRPTQ